ncbi:Hypothetical protein SMAX5B_020008 [Scophthalmus maximus]|nr:Hypothetical protein SMAX5B_020008 [Scophthalmus maximus]
MPVGGLCTFDPLRPGRSPSPRSPAAVPGTAQASWKKRPLFPEIQSGAARSRSQRYEEAGRVWSSGAAAGLSRVVATRVSPFASEVDGATTTSAGRFRHLTSPTPPVIRFLVNAVADELRGLSTAASTCRTGCCPAMRHPRCVKRVAGLAHTGSSSSIQNKSRRIVSKE